MKLRILIAAAVLVALSSFTHRLRKADKEIATALDGSQRFVDYGVILKVVRQDPEGAELIHGVPKLRVLREHEFGGMIDTTADPVGYCGKTENPVTWLCSEAGEEVLLHENAGTLCQLVYGAMGAGKSVLTAQWLGLLVLKHVGFPGDFGCTAPTNPRLGEIRAAINSLWPRQWRRQYHTREQTYHLASDHTVRLISTHQRSKDAGSPIQNWSWMGCASEEIQDCTEVDEDIEARGRYAPLGYHRLANATVKDSPKWREWRDRVLATPDWQKRTMRGVDSPFIKPEHWERLKRTMTAASYARKVLAEDVASESRVYNAFTRERNVRPLQQVPAWEDVTARELSRWARNATVLVGYDPGRLFDVSVILKAYQPPTPQATRKDPNPRIPDPVWFVVGEVTTEQATTEQHCRELLKMLRERWGCNRTADGPQAFVRADPATTTGTDENRPHISVYEVFKQHGLNVKAGAYKPGAVNHAQIPKEARIDMVNTLFHSADGNVRLVVQCDDRANLRAPKLVDAIESLERDGDGRAEAGRKDKTDKTHWPCALGIALWSIEKPRLESLRGTA